MTTKKSIIKVITLYRPWPTMISDPFYGKDVENRTWNCPLKVGDYLAIHSGLKFDVNALEFIKKIGFDSSKIDPNNLPSGVITCIARFGGNVTDHPSKWFAGPVGWLLEDVTPIEPVPAKGQQVLWVPEEPTLEKLRENFRKAKSLVRA